MDARPSRVAALVLVVEPDRQPVIDADLVASAPGLTPSQGSMAAMLARGCSPREIAEATQRKEVTVRWHLKQVFSRLRDCPAVGPGAAGAVGVVGRTVVAARSLTCAVPFATVPGGGAPAGSSLRRARRDAGDILRHETLSEERFMKFSGKLQGCHGRRHRTVQWGKSDTGRQPRCGDRGREQAGLGKTTRRSHATTALTLPTTRPTRYSTSSWPTQMRLLRWPTHCVTTPRIRARSPMHCATWRSVTKRWPWIEKRPGSARGPARTRDDERVIEAVRSGRVPPRSRESRAPRPELE